MNDYSKTSDYSRLCYSDAPSRHAGCGIVAHTLSTPPSDGKYSTQQIVVTDKSNNRHIITAGGKRERNPVVSPCGKRLLFLSDACDGEQLWYCELDFGTPVRLTHMRNGVSDPVWSPCGSSIAFTSVCSPLDDTAALQTPLSQEELKRLELESRYSPVEITEKGYKNDANMGFCTMSISHVWQISLDGSPAVRLSDGDRDHVMPIFSPDGKTIVFASNRERDRADYIAMDLYTVPSGGGEIKRLTRDIWVAYYPKPVLPIFTSDGKYIICGGLAPSLSGGVPPVHLFRVSLTGECEDLFPEGCTADASCFLYNGEGGNGGRTQCAQISSDGQLVYFLSGFEGGAHLHSATIYGERSVNRLTGGAFCIRSLDTPQDGSLLCIKTDFSSPQEIYSIDEKTLAFSKATHTNDWLDHVPLSKPYEVWFDTLDGKGRVQGWAFPPQNAKKGNKYPAILYIHGGPSPFYGCALTYEHQAICGAGFGLIFCNPRGSSGYGAEHGGGKYATDGTAYTDILQFTSECVRRFDWIDGQRLGITGGSYGGYMTNWIIGHSKRFKAAVTQRSISNEVLQALTSDMASSTTDYKDFTDYQMAMIEKSPVAYAEQIDIPLLILHSMQDMRCTIDQAHQLFVAVKDFHPHLPVRLVAFPHSNHSMIMGAGSPGMGTLKMRLRHYDETIGWFKKYL